MEIRTDDFTELGLYLLLPGGKQIALTRRRIDEFARTFEAGLDRFPVEIRSSVHFKACPVCPERNRAGFCHALPATLAFLDDLSEFRSYDKVGAVYRDSDRTLVCVPETTMQEALQFVAILSLIHHCEVGREYRRFLRGIHPLMDPTELTARVHLNIYWDCKGDRARISETMLRFSNELTCTCRCQVQRLQLVCKHDALVNAFVNTQAQIECLTLAAGDAVDRQLEEFLAGG